MELTKREINGNNTMIAEFMGDLTDTGQEPAFVPYKGKGYELHELEYHKSWDWLMPVVEKIESLDKWIFDIYENKCEVEFGKNLKIDDITFEEKTKIEAVYKACIAFIEWYNQENKQKE